VNSRYLNVLRTGFLICDVSPYRRFGNGADTAQVVATTPESGHSRFEPRKFFSQFVGCESLELSRQVCGSQSRIGLNKHVNVVGHDFQSVNFRVQFLGLLVQQLPKPFFNRPNQHLQSVFGAPDQMILERVNGPGTDAVSGIHPQSSVAQKLYTRNTINRRAAFLCPLKGAVPCGVIYGLQQELGVFTGVDARRRIG
jgi:hypothetical protein